MSRRVGDMRQIEKYLLGHDRKEKERLFSNKMEAIVRYETFSWQKRYVRLTWPRKQGPYSERCGLIYDSVMAWLHDGMVVSLHDGNIASWPDRIMARLCENRIASFWTIESSDGDTGSAKKSEM